MVAGRPQGRTAFAHALTTVEQVGRHTQAGTGCGGCRVRVQALLDEREAAAIGELRETV